MTTPARKTNAAKGRRGNQEADELKAALNPDIPVFAFPPDLNPLHEKIWTEIVNTKTGDYWTKGDIPLLKMYCRCAYDIERLTEDIDTEGEVIFNARGNPVVNPKVVVRGFAEGRLMTLATKLRMQPSSRTDPRTEDKSNTRKKAAAGAAQKIAESGEDGDPESENLLAGAGLPVAGGKRLVQ